MSASCLNVFASATIVRPTYVWINKYVYMQSTSAEDLAKRVITYKTQTNTFSNVKGHPIYSAI